MDTKKRPSWDAHFLRRAEVNAEMATCNRLKVGAVIVKDKRVIGDGFNGSPAGHDHCVDVGCLTNEEGRCIRTIHAEHNALLQCREDPKGATVYVTHEPCENCAKVLAQKGIKRVVFKNAYLNKYNHHFNKDMEWEHFEEEHHDS